MPDPWVVRFHGLIPAGGTILDLACGAGRHTKFLLERGYKVLALDRDISRLQAPGAETLQADIEAGAWPLTGRKFDGIVVTNYLHRPLVKILADSLKPNGVLIYLTFAVGNEQFGRPTNPDFLLKPRELFETYAGLLEIVAYESGERAHPRPSMIQAICAVKSPIRPPVLPD
jgi:SAM-dependent methyltransferase